MSTSSARIVVVGAGPRPSGLLERLGANAAEFADAHVRIDLVDPSTPGAGRIWDAHESPLLLMNSRAMDVTMFTDEASSIDGPVRPGPSLAQWAEGIREGSIAAPTAGTERLAEIEALTPESFPSRRVQALYLEWVFGRVLADLPESIEVRIHRRLATGIEQHDASARGAAEPGSSWRVALDDGTSLSADLVLVTVGHTDARPTPAQRDLHDFAARHGGVYASPSHADGVDLASLPAGRDVILRGMGLGAVDLIALLAEGRGGSFSPAPLAGEPDRLSYEPSGEEPVLWLGSRRGTPFHSKVRGEDVPAGPSELAHLTPEALDAAEDAEGHVDFERSVLPLVAAEIRHAVPGVALGRTDSEGWDLLTALDDPLVGLFASDGAPPDDAAEALRRTRDVLVGHIESDLRERTEEDPTQARALFQVLLRITGALARLLPAERLSPASRGSYPGLWHSLFSFVCSGPPPRRLQQILALERAGLLHFLGPRLQVTADEETGEFVAEGAGGARVRTCALVDAFLPAPTLEGSSNSFLRRLGTDIGASDPHAPGRLRTDGEGRVLDAEGEPVPGLWAVGPATSEFPLGAFARPRTDAPVFRRNDALARTLLAEAEAVAAGGPSTDAGHPAHDVGIVGAGKIGTAIARQAVRSGLHVHVETSRDARSLSARIPGAVAGLRTPSAGEVVVLTMPFHAVFDLDPERLRGAVVVDATNPWGPEDLAAIEQARGRFGADLSSSELVAAHLVASRVAKALNHIGYHDVEDHPRPAGASDRRALAIASDDEFAAARVASLLDRLGYDAVLVDGLGQARHLEPDGAVFGSHASRDVLTAALEAADAAVLTAA
ncbi:FAD/NAD(P)-binding protein [Brachybacterium kimchii]|uniref:FAD/NAD(P)-binding protein n=1 Tax=Brachybacterium kimchii TaxID=2942909 RepID=A0ABY4N930_9MICO|nr:FAD/NAD(P)-binding protein [Brachybacterium kimchii]UQN30311.1 FAD/NAD(P)-binding protein [Brachybacterium kimchii]